MKRRKRTTCLYQLYEGMKVTTTVLPQRLVVNKIKLQRIQQLASRYATQSFYSEMILIQAVHRLPPDPALPTLLCTLCPPLCDTQSRRPIQST
jgi:hypothetical protein